jgi:hypothetical protein
MSKWWELYRGLMPDDVDLVSSRGTPGLLRGFFLDEDGIRGHAEFSKVDLRKPAIVLSAVALAAGLVGGIAITKNAPRIKRWWGDEVIPAARAGWKWVARQQGEDTNVATETTFLTPAARESFSREIDVALDENKTSMSSAEAQRYLLEILMAASIIADRVRALSNARIEDDAGLPELKVAMEKLTTQDVTDTINRMLAADTSMLDDETIKIFVDVFGGGHIVDGEYVPLTNERIKKVMSLDPRTDDPLS